MKYLLLTFLTSIISSSGYDPDKKAFSLLNSMSENYKKMKSFSTIFTYSMINLTENISDSFEGKILFEYKTTQVTSIDLPLYQGPIQVIGQMLCTGIRQAIIMRFNIRTWQIEYWPIVFDEKTADTIKAAVIDFWDHVKNKKF